MRGGDMAEWRVRVAAGEQRIAGRIRAIRKSEEAIERAQRKITRKQQQGKIKAAAETREYGCYILVFTTGTSRQATTRQVLECCRSRWRIELEVTFTNHTDALLRNPELPDSLHGQQWGRKGKIGLKLWMNTRSHKGYFKDDCAIITVERKPQDA